jgi:hypothetical protein
MNGDQGMVSGVAWSSEQRAHPRRAVVTSGSRARFRFLEKDDVGMEGGEGSPLTLDGRTSAPVKVPHHDAKLQHGATYLILDPVGCARLTDSINLSVVVLPYG